MRTRHLAPEVGWLNIPHWSEKWPGTAAVVNPHGFRYVTDHHDELPLTDDMGCEESGSAQRYRTQVPRQKVPKGW